MSPVTAASTAPVARMSRWRETWGYFKWFFNPWGSLSARDLYELVSTRAFSKTGLYLNLGYWKDAKTIDEACVAMARLVSDTAQLGPQDSVVDVGFGFADQDIYWVDTHGVRRITGLNITPSQVALARSRVAERGLSERIELLEASATDMPLAAGAYDKVVGLECAFHFDTREDFFGEALRVLRPGGRLVLADVILNDPVPGRFARAMQKSTWNSFVSKYSVPTANADLRAGYADKLRAAGFVNVSVTSIREHVYPGLHHYMKTEPEMLRRFHPLARLPYHLLLRFKPESVFSAYDYVIASADKPA
jgi:cyclopropane fatty-acyl-phospholipid synthase-like methyltransferase